MRTALTVLAVALGVSAVLAIELAGQAAVGSFRSSLETLTGGANLEVSAAGGVPGAVFARLTMAPYPLKLHPRIEDYGVIAGKVKRTIPIIGIDVLSEQTLSSVPSGEDPQPPSDLQLDNSVWLTSGLGFRRGDSIHLLVNDTAADFNVAGVLDGQAGEGVLMDLAPAARLLRRGGRLDRVLIEAPSTRSVEEWTRLLRKDVPASITISRQGTQTDENRHMLEAFRWNLRVLSYVSLAVGAFLIYNTISVSVVRRRHEIGILRAIGAPRLAVLAGFLGEAACFGLLGGIGGIILGRILSEGAVKLVGATVASLYFSSRPAPVTLTGADILLGIGMGIGIALISALGPSWEASRVAPVEAMARGRSEHHLRVHRWRTAGAALLLASAAWIASGQDAVNGKPIYGYLCALLSIIASALFVPLLVSGSAAITTGLLSRIFGIEALLASRSLAGSLRRTSVLVGALSTAIAVLPHCHQASRTGSFRETVMVWLNDALQADLFLASRCSCRGGPPSNHVGGESPGYSVKLSEVDAVDQLRTYEIRYQGLTATLGGMDARIAGRRRKQTFLSGARSDAVFSKLIGTNTVIVSEPFANKHQTKAGDILKLGLGDKVGAFRVLDIYYDYSSERGVILMDRETLFRYLPGVEPNNVAVYLKAGVTVENGQATSGASHHGEAGRRRAEWIFARASHQGFRPNLRDHVCAGGSSCVRGGDGGWRRIGGTRDRSPSRIWVAPLPGCD